MRIVELRLHWVRIPLHEPFRISSGEVSAKDAILVELTAEDGTKGWGEASPMTGSFYSAETPESTWKFLCDRLVPNFLSRPELDPQQCSDQLAEFPGEPFAKAGLEGAVWDLRANRERQPLWAMLGGSARPIETGAAIGLFPTVEELLERVNKFLGQGYRRIKIKIAPGHDVELVRAVRGRFGGIPLMVDANAAYGVRDFRVFKELDRYDLMMIEQPLARESLEEHAELQRQLRTPICLDESAEDLEAVQKIIRLQSARILNIKVQRMGGLWRAKRAHDAAEAAGIPCWLGTMPQLGIASAQGLHLRTLPNFLFPTDVEASSRWFADDIIAPPIEVSREGLIEFPEGPGTGFTVLPDKIAKFRICSEVFRL
ncbi:MAG: o-succinylbenzoate synthase [Acidobacteria bacterium]|nr:MAG: o-succinylbenzoate synthase [Acidobacteriota bacterium]